ncbi:MlaD family protein [Mycobacteroides chelonae]|uniref:MlaD family protein n=1 Tax=Mycobacteroides chelonae TaxID=1774 RepID=UPI0008A8EE88|nr:MlaD family protein [Mycobacteroides chelonae]OHU64945.1 mammalian cell entry protein [Mycobacteroides chelonae]
MINAVANAVVGAVRAGHSRKSVLSTMALILTLLLAVTYLCVGALRANPFASTYRVTVKLSESGGLLPRQDVALRGVKIGTVQSLAITPQGVDATAEIQSKYKIPAAAKVRVTGLSPAGEQYINFEGTPGEQGPYLVDGSVISEGAQVPVTLAKLLADADGLLAQVDPKKLELIKKELSLSKEGPRKLTEIIDGGTFLLSTLDSVLPETTSLLKTSRVVLTLAADKSAGIKATADSLGRTLRGVEKMQNGYRTLVDQTPKTLSAVDNLFNDNSDTMVQLLASLATTSQVFYMRIPALNAFFPNYRGSVFGAITAALHDGGIWGTADLYPRYVCDYGSPRAPASTADFPEPFLYANYCADKDPGVLIRGAKNAPRPAGDDTAGPPEGADLAKTTDSTPKGRFTIPTPYGGPTLPIEPPR